MVIAVHSASLALLISFAFAFGNAIRTLKDGPMIDAEGREYKSANFRTEAEDIRWPQLDDESTVRVQCTDTAIIIVVKADLYKNGRLVSPEELFLREPGHSKGSRCQAVPVSDTEYLIEAGLQDCGFKLTLSEDSVIYSNELIISPAAGYHGITRTYAVVPVSCHYKRTHVVSSNVEQPHLGRSLPAKVSSADFSLKLVTDDWLGETFTTDFNIGELIQLKASYNGPDLGQGRLFIDSCVATLSPDVTSVPRYYFIENHGCLTDAKEYQSKSLFQPRTSASSLKLQLDAFLFHQDSRNSIFITCQLKVTSERWTTSPINKACNYVDSRWNNVDGSDECQCCDSICSTSIPDYYTKMRQQIPEDIVACGIVALGPLLIFPTTQANN